MTEFDIEKAFHVWYEKHYGEPYENSINRNHYSSADKIKDGYTAGADFGEKEGRLKILDEIYPKVLEELSDEVLEYIDGELKKLRGK